MKLPSEIIVDMRILRDRTSFGLLNSTIGLKYSFFKLKYLINEEWQLKLLESYCIPRNNIIFTKNIFKDFFFINKHLILPIQKPRILTKILNSLGLLHTHTIVHDLFYLSGNKLLKREFRSPIYKFKKKYYNHSIKTSSFIYVYSKIVRRQVKFIFGREAEILNNKRIFSVNINCLSKIKNYDFYLPLSDRFYKGMWIMDRLFFTDKHIKIAVSAKYSEKIKSLLVKNNPTVEIISVDVTSDLSLAQIYSQSKFTLCLSRFEGFGFSPYEAVIFGSNPVLLNMSAMIELPNNLFNKINLNGNLNISISDLNQEISEDLKALCKKHIILKT